MRIVLLVAVFALAPLAAQAQIAHAAFDNPTFVDNNSTGGPNLLIGIRTQVPSTFLATRVEVFTGEQAGPNTLALWSHDATNNRPLAPLADGSWLMARRNGWQGAPLTVPTVLQQGQEVWIVWGCQNGSQTPSHGTGAGAQPYRGSFDGGQTWSGPFQSIQWKFRIWTGAAGHYEVFGSGCSGAAGVPQIGWDGLPMAGGTFDVHLDRAVANGFAVLTFGDSNTNENGTPLPFSLQPFGAPACSLLGSLAATVLAPVDATGHAVITGSLPNDPTLVGFRFYDQWFCFDPAANALGFTVSNGGAAIVGS